MSSTAVCDSIPIPLRPGEPLGATLPPNVLAHPDSGVVIGTVTETGSNRTLSGAVVLFRAMPPADSLRRPRRAVYTSRGGGFEARALAPGGYRLRVSRIGALPYEREIDVRAGVIDTFVVQLRPWRCVGM